MNKYSKIYDKRKQSIHWICSTTKTKIFFFLQHITLHLRRKLIIRPCLRKAKRPQKEKNNKIAENANKSERKSENEKWQKTVESKSKPKWNNIIYTNRIESECILIVSIRAPCANSKCDYQCTIYSEINWQSKQVKSVLTI